MVDTIKNNRLHPNHLLFTLLMSTLVALLAYTSAEARQPQEGWTPPEPPISNASPVRIDIVDDRGRAFRQIPTISDAQDSNRAYLEAKKGASYSLRLRNTSNQRIGVVIAVDGRNILSGQKSWLGHNEQMYVLGPYESANYQGWRTGQNRVNRFFFTGAGDSYANAWGDKSAMGVIAVAVFNEKPRPQYRSDNSLGNNKLRRSAPTAAADEAGTGFGSEEYSPSIKVSFKPQQHPASKSFFKYEWRDTLCKRGILSCDARPQPQPHNRFWSNDGYAPYPPGSQRNDYRPYNGR